MKLSITGLQTLTFKTFFLIFMNIAEFLQDKFPGADISSDGADCSSKLLIVSSSFEGLSTLQRHKLVMRALKDHFQSGEIHALSLSTKTPAEI
jgi:acid stress-induced BolA-like protein IbaG/YrbA